MRGLPKRGAAAAPPVPSFGTASTQPEVSVVALRNHKTELTV